MFAQMELLVKPAPLDSLKLEIFVVIVILLRIMIILLVLAKIVLKAAQHAFQLLIVPLV